MKKEPVILVINTGSTTTKMAVFKGEEILFEEKITHNVDELQALSGFEQQVDYRKNIIEKVLKNRQIDVEKMDLIMCRGGLIKPVESGVYQVNKKMLEDLRYAPKQHASNLAAVIGYRLSKHSNVYIADPVVVDEMQDIARYAGHKLFQRISIFHALNHKAVARKFAAEKRKKYEDLNLIVAHMGGGISVGAHKKGKVIDVNQALDGEGAFSPERSGTLPAGDLVKMAFSEKYSLQEMREMIVGKGGLVSYTGSNNLQELEKNATPEIKEILEAMAYQVAKQIGEMASVLQGNVDAIILTGGVAHSPFITRLITERITFIAPVYIYAGEDEMQALAYNGNLIWKKELTPKDY